MALIDMEQEHRNFNRLFYGIFGLTILLAVVSVGVWIYAINKVATGVQDGSLAREAGKAAAQIQSEFKKGLEEGKK